MNPHLKKNCTAPDGIFKPSEPYHLQQAPAYAQPKDPLAPISSFWRRWENGGNFSPISLSTSCSHLAALSLNKIISAAPQQGLCPAEGPEEYKPIPPAPREGSKERLTSPAFPALTSSFPLIPHVFPAHTASAHIPPPQKIRKKKKSHLLSLWHRISNFKLAARRALPISSLD